MSALLVKHIGARGSENANGHAKVYVVCSGRRSRAEYKRTTSSEMNWNIRCFVCGLCHCVDYSTPKQGKCDTSTSNSRNC